VNPMAISGQRPGTRPDGKAIAAAAKLPRNPTSWPWRDEA